MSAVILEEIKNIKLVIQVDLKTLLQVYVKILETNVVTKPIVIDNETGIILDGHDIFQALQLLSARKIPVLRVKFPGLSIEPAYLKETIIRVGLRDLSSLQGVLKLFLRESYRK